MRASVWAEKRVAVCCARRALPVSPHGAAIATTTPGGEAPAAPDLVARKFNGRAAQRALVCRHHLRAHLAGLALPAAVVDACSRYCVGWSMRDDLSAELVYDALGMAVHRRRPRR